MQYIVSKHFDENHPPVRSSNKLIAPIVYTKYWMSKRLAHFARGVKDLLTFHFLASFAIQFLFLPHFLDDTQVIEKKSGADKLSLRREKPLIRRQLERSILLAS